MNGILEIINLENDETLFRGQIDYDDVREIPGIVKSWCKQNGYSYEEDVDWECEI